MDQKRDEWIDAVKGIAILGVVLVHSMGRIELPYALQEICLSGERGVQIFFIIAAYLAYGSFERNQKKGRNSIAWLKGRVKRIAPAYYIALAIGLFFLGGPACWVGIVEKVSIGNVAAHILFLHGLSPYYINSLLGIEWYLADYAILMLLIPVLYKMIHSFSRAVAFFVCSSIGSYLFILLSRNWSIIGDEKLWDIYIGSFCFLAQLPVMALGIVLYFVVNNSGIVEACRSKKLLSYALLIGAIYGFVIMIAGVSFKGLTIQTVYGGILFFFILSQAVHGCPLVVNRFWRELGKYSYIIYLFHYFFFMGFDHFFEKYASYTLKTWVIRLLFVLGMSYGAAFLTGQIKNMLKRGFGWKKNRC